jgi:hypothetical protein
MAITELTRESTAIKKNHPAPDFTRLWRVRMSADWAVGLGIAMLVAVPGIDAADGGADGGL